jgi:hypothetical protein
MTPKEKAKELIQKFYPNVQWKLGQEDCLKRAKNCALIAVDEILTYQEQLLQNYKVKLENSYWYKVQQEIENYDT